MALVRPEHLNAYADSAQAPFQLGELVRRLIYNTIKPGGIEHMGFHSGTANNLPDWDGRLRLLPDAAGTVHSSVWELSTRGDTAQKIRTDFEKRIGAAIPDGWTRATTTLVLVTCRKLKDPYGLAKELKGRKDNPWQQVRIYDGPALSQWIEKCPATEAWCAEELKIGNGQFGQSFQGFWREWSTGTIPAISTELVIAGRPRISAIACANPVAGQMVTVQADSPEEAAAYVYAELGVSCGQEARHQMMSATLVIRSEDAAKRCALEPVPLGAPSICVLLPPATGAAGQLRTQGRFVINALGKAEQHGLGVQPIARGLYSNFSSALEGMKLLPEQALREARACGSSVTVWALWNRTEQGAGAAALLPSWAHVDRSPAAVPLVLAGTWDAAYEGDKKVLATLAGDKTYRELERTFASYLANDQPLLQRIGSVMAIVAPTAAFVLSVNAVTDSDLEALAKASMETFTRVDDISRAEYNKTRHRPIPDYSVDCSKWIKTGLAESLLQLSVFASRFSGRASSSGGVQRLVDATVTAVTSLTADPVYFHALSDQWPLLAEAAPQPFLDAVEATIGSSVGDLSALFAETNVFTPNLFAGLIHALECLAWDASLLRQVTKTLLRLSAFDRIALDPKNNRVLQQLRAIYQAMMPGTAACSADRIAILKSLHDETPDQVWQLLLFLTPETWGNGGQTTIPRWKDFGRSTTDHGSVEQRQEASQAYSQLAMELSSGQPEKLLALLPRYPKLSVVNRATLLQALADVWASGGDEGLKRKTWEEVRGLMKRHRAYPAAKWALPEAQLKLLDRLEERIRPTNVAELHGWLFATDEPISSASGVLAATELARLRDVAIAEVKAQAGIKGLADLIFASGQGYVPSIAIDATLTMPQALELCGILAVASTTEGQFALRMFSSIRYAKHGNDWTAAMLMLATDQQWNEGAIAASLLGYPDAMPTYELVKSQGAAVDEIFWSLFHPSLRSIDAPRVLTYKIFRFIAAGRAVELLTQAGGAWHTGLLLRVIRASTRELLSKGHRGDVTMLVYGLTLALDQVAERPGVTNATMAVLELPLFRLLADEPYPRGFAIHMEMAVSPECFLFLLAWLYRAEADDHDEPLDREVTNRAEIAFKVFETWQSPPGADLKRMDGKVLNAWIDEVRARAQSDGRLLPADRHIGAVLLHTPREESTKTWPSETVAKTIERIASIELEQGLEIEVVNSRGVTTREILSGGNLEREDVERWKRAAEAVNPAYPRVKAMCLRVAASFRDTAEHQDLHAELLRLQWRR